MMEFKAGRFKAISENIHEFPTRFIDEKTKTFTDFSTGRYGSIIPEPVTEEAENFNENIIRINETAQKLFISNRKAAESYCKERNLTKEDLDTFGIGASTEIVKPLLKAGYTEDDILAAGLAKRGDDGNIRELFYKRLMFSIYNKNGRIIGFSGRVMDKSKICKYLNTPETEVFRKRTVLYMYNKASRAECTSYILCEGYMDVIAMHKEGFINTVASMGTSLTKEQIKLLKTKPHIYMMLDSDEAGINAAKRNIPPLMREGIVVKAVDLFPYKDPDEFLKAEGKQKMIERLRNAISGKEFLRKHYRAGDNHEIVNIILE